MKKNWSFSNHIEGEVSLFDQLVAETIAVYRSRFGSEPLALVAAPGRVNLIGEHTDYNDGFVFPMAIERYTVIAAGEKPLGDDRFAEIFSQNMNKTKTFLIDGSSSPLERPHWSNYVQGAIACSLEKGLSVPSFRAVINSNVPIGGGLSSSASLEVAIATLMERLSGVTLPLADKALLCQKAEHEYAKMPCGIMDQFISVMGQKDHAMLLDCRSRVPVMIPLLDPNIVILISNTNVKHSLTGGQYAKRRASCEQAASILGVNKLRDVTREMLEAAKDKLCNSNDDTVYRRARHVVGEDHRTSIMAQALIDSDWQTVGEQMYASHYSLKNDYEVSCPELDVLVEIAESLGTAKGVIGSRMTGGGFGGCTVTLVRNEHLDTVQSTFETEYKARTGIVPTLFATRPAQGATVLW